MTTLAVKVCQCCAVATMLFVSACDVEEVAQRSVNLYLDGMLVDMDSSTQRLGNLYLDGMFVDAEDVGVKASDARARITIDEMIENER